MRIKAYSQRVREMRRRFQLSPPGYKSEGKDPFHVVRPPLERVEKEIKKTELTFNLDDVPLDDKKVLVAMVSKQAGKASRGITNSFWAPLAGGTARRILNLAGIKTPTLDELVLIRSLPRGRQHVRSLTDEFVARRSGSQVVRAVEVAVHLGRYSATTVHGYGGWQKGPELNPGEIYDVVYPAPKLLRPILKSSFGLIFWKQQVASICERIAGLTGKEADSFLMTLTCSWRQTREPLERFLIGAKKKGCSEAETNEVLWYVHRYGGRAGPMDEVYVRESTRLAYLHAWMWTYYPLIYRKAIDENGEQG